MKNKILKIIIIILLVLVILLLTNLVRNYIVLKSIENTVSNLKENMSNYHFKFEGKGDSDDEGIMLDCYYKDGIALIKNNFMNNEYITWLNIKTKEVEGLRNGEIINDEMKNDFLDGSIGELDMYNLMFFSYDAKNIMLDYIFKPILIKDNYYKIVVKTSRAINEYYINKDSKLIEKLIIKGDNGITEHTYELKRDMVTDKDVERLNQ